MSIQPQINFHGYSGEKFIRRVEMLSKKDNDKANPYAQTADGFISFSDIKDALDQINKWPEGNNAALKKTLLQMVQVGPTPFVPGPNHYAYNNSITSAEIDAWSKNQKW